MRMQILAHDLFSTVLNIRHVSANKVQQITKGAAIQPWPNPRYVMLGPEAPGRRETLYTHPMKASRYHTLYLTLKKPQIIYRGMRYLLGSSLLTWLNWSQSLYNKVRVKFSVWFNHSSLP